MVEDFESLFGSEALGETPAPFDLSELTVGQALTALQIAMSKDGGTRSQTIRDVPIGPDVYTLKFGVGEAEFIQERHEMGPQYAQTIIGFGRWSVKLLVDVVYIALVGGGEKPEAARRIADRWVAKRPWGESAPLAQIILQAGVVGVPDEPPGKPEGEAVTDPLTSPEAKSGSDPSTGTPPLPE